MFIQKYFRLKLGITNNKLLRSHYLANYLKRRKSFDYHPEASDRFSDTTKSHFSLIYFTTSTFIEKHFEDTKSLLTLLQQLNDVEHFACWIDMTGINPESLKEIGQYFQIQNLLLSDILSFGQRAKQDDMGNQVFALMPMLSYNKESDNIESDQLCLLLKDRFVLTFHNNQLPGYFSQLKEKLQKEDSPVRNNKTDYLSYLLMDAVVDHYFDVTDILSDQLDKMEELVVTNPDKSVLFNLTLLRHKVLIVKRAITPVRELINSFCLSENPLIFSANKKFFKDIHDHITLAVEYNDNYREIIINLQDLYMNQVNTKMNEVMKMLTIITALLAPFTVISGIYGMNFNRIPLSSRPFGFVLSILLMLLVSCLMLVYFRKKGWF